MKVLNALLLVSAAIEWSAAKVDARAVAVPSAARQHLPPTYDDAISAGNNLHTLPQAARCRGGAITTTAACGRRAGARRAEALSTASGTGRGIKGWGQLRPHSTPDGHALRGGGATASPTTAVTKSAYRTALLRTCLLFASAGAFGLGTIVIKGRQAGLEFFAGYLVEQSLSVDNLFIFIMLFEYFKVPPEFQSRVLNWGIIGAVSMRAVMIVVGVAAIERFRWVMLFFAGILVVSSVNLLLEGEEDHNDTSHLENNAVLKVAKWMCDSVDFYDGEKFFTTVDGVKKATPLLLCLICIELTDFVFAVDSIPAVLGISHDTFIVYASNVFAICAMRSIYTLVSHAISDLPYLKPAVALVLGFVGGKMFAEFFHYEVSIGVSLSVVAGILTVGAVASIISNRRRDAALARSVSGGGSEGLTFNLMAQGASGAAAPLTPVAPAAASPAAVSEEALAEDGGVHRPLGDDSLYNPGHSVQDASHVAPEGQAPLLDTPAVSMSNDAVGGGSTGNGDDFLPPILEEGEAEEGLFGEIPSSGKREEVAHDAASAMEGAAKDGAKSVGDTVGEGNKGVEGVADAAANLAGDIDSKIEEEIVPALEEGLGLDELDKK